MRVLLISSNQIGPTQISGWVPVVPLGLAYVAASLRNAGHQVELLDLCFVGKQDAAIVDAIKRLQPEVIGISFRNIEMMAYFQNISFLGELRWVVELCRQHSMARIVLGGSGFSIMPGQILRYTGLDVGIVGEGEWSLLELLTRLECSLDYSDVPGVVRIEDNSVHLTPPTHNHDLTDLPAPARDLIDHSPYIKAGGIANLQTKRGCPFQCIYCIYPLVEGKNVRCRPPEEIVDEFRELNHRFGVSVAYIVDNQFNYPPEHAKEICEGLISIRDEVKVWWSCMVNPGYLSEELVFLLRLARCAMVELGIESASKSVLSNLGKNYTVQEVRNAIMLLKEYRLPFNTWVLFGGPGETEETVKETLEFLVELEVPRVLFSIGLRVYPGTKIERLMLDEGRINPEIELLDPVFYLAMDAEAIVELVRPYLYGRKDWHIAALRHPVIARHDI